MACARTAATPATRSSATHGGQRHRARRPGTGHSAALPQCRRAGGAPATQIWATAKDLGQPVPRRVARSGRRVRGATAAATVATVTITAGRNPPPCELQKSVVDTRHPPPPAPDGCNRRVDSSAAGSARFNGAARDARRRHARPPPAPRATANCVTRDALRRRTRPQTAPRTAANGVSHASCKTADGVPHVSGRVRAPPPMAPHTATDEATSTMSRGRRHARPRTSH